MLDLDKIIDEAPPTSGKIMHLLERLRSAGEPIRLSINGVGDLPIADDGAFQLLFSLIERLELTEMLRDRLAEVDAGCSTFTREQAMEMIRSKHGISV